MGFVATRVAHSLVVCIVFLSAVMAQGALPALPVPAEPVSQAQRDADVKVFSAWWNSYVNPPDIKAVCRMKAWGDAHPEDAEALFFVAISYQYNLAYDLVKPAEIRREDTRALLKRAAESGYTPARARWAHALLDPRKSADQDLETGRKILEECISKDDADANIIKGYFLETGKVGFARDLAAAKSCFEKAAQLGTVNGKCYAAVIQGEMGDEVGALAVLREFAEAGQPQAQLTVGLQLLAKGKTREEKHAGFEWVKRSAEGQRWFDQAHSALGECYEKGKGTQIDKKQAFRWYSLAWELDDEKSGLWVAQAHLQGFGTEVDYKKYLDVMSKVAERGYAPAQVGLARIYLAGLLVKRDRDRAKELLEAAAAQKDQNAIVYRQWVKFAEDEQLPK